MALSSTTVRALYNANGATVNFAIPATIISSDSTEVKVYTRDDSTTPPTTSLKVEGYHLPQVPSACIAAIISATLTL